MKKKPEEIVESEEGRLFNTENGGFHHAADGTKLHRLSDCRAGKCWTDTPGSKEPCGDYEGNKVYGQYLDGNPCARCRRPEKAHTEDARKRWQTLCATMTF